MRLASFIVPAHNESTVLPATLDRIASDPLAASLEVVVVANACTDSTAAKALEFADRLPGLTVIETEIPGKANALNLGDQAATAFPRIFLDADIVLGPGALEGMVSALSIDAPVVGSPAIRFDLTGADRWVRDYYRVFERLPYLSEGLVGLGVYGVSELGRRRFERFPDLMADDLYIQRLFEPAERIRTPGEFVVRTPRRWADLVRVRTRVDRGNAQIAAAADSLEAGHDYGRTSASSVRSLVDLVAARPKLAPSAVVYVATTVTAKIRARMSGDHWGRDESSRVAQEGAADPDPEPTAPPRSTAGAAHEPVAYLISQYPFVSHTFVEREIEGLRRLGTPVHSFSVRYPGALLSETMRSEAERTLVLQESVSALAGVGLREALAHPTAVLGALGRAVRTGEGRVRSRVWQLFYAGEAMRLLAEMRRLNVRHVHAHFANVSADIARAAVAYARGVDPDGGWQWSFTMHGPTEFDAVDHYDLAGKVAAADGVACVSDFTRSQLMRLSDPADWEKLQVVHMSVDTEKFVPPAEPRPVDGPLRILDVGRLVPEKGASILLDAAAQLAESGVDFQVRLVGGGELEADLRRAIAKRGLSNRVTLTGPLGQDDILAEYHWADVFCLPSFQEGLPVALMEAMATGLPVVTTPISGIPELVRDGHNGRLVAPGRADLLADTLAQLASDADMRHRLGAAAREDVVAGFALDACAAAQQRFLDQIGRHTPTRSIGRRR
ncbi:MAG: glycosyltransferase [Micropruina sp.]|uniref:glycosyltransferase n=1 Tax=Micropruina sp. TaxID=2737536 RepID=UPI0039E64CDB